ncbi:hypothetical protein C8R43DRAFT_1162615 [Mycena crocata]|nr:hypothetical protein C8R43DRAFT_1162615 [Mycena crocata]
MRAPIEGLSEYLFLLVCLDLNVPDILSLRQVCRIFCAATRHKLLWMNLLEVLRSEGHVLPPYLKVPSLLDAATLEAVVLRVARLARKWKANDICPVNTWRLHLCQSITWLRLVCGSWLFVASSDNEVSKISCWDLSLMFQGYMDPIAEAYLPGQVKTAQLEVQDEGVVIGLGLGPKAPSVHVITLREHLGSHYFAELCRVEGSSHVLMLHGHLLGCALRHNDIVPHLVNWRENMIHDLPLPVESDAPDNRSAPHLLVAWNDYIVVVRRDTLQFYTLPSISRGPIYIKSIATMEMWEVVALDRFSQSPSPLALLVLSASGVSLLTLESNVMFNDNAYCTLLLATAPAHRDRPWYHLTANGAGQRAYWLAAERMHDYPHVVSMTIAPLPSELNSPRVKWTNDVPHDPALWAHPSIDFDEALGYAAIGNCFGELAIYDSINFDPLTCCGLAPNFTDQATQLPPLLPLTPIPLDLQLAPKRPSGMTKSDRSITLHWTQDDLGLDHRSWCTDMFCGRYWNWDMWQGNIGDTAWLLDRAFGFPGTIIPQAHAVDPHSEDTYVFSLLHTANHHASPRPSGDIFLILSRVPWAMGVRPLCASPPAWAPAAASAPAAPATSAASTAAAAPVRAPTPPPMRYDYGYPPPPHRGITYAPSPYYDPQQQPQPHQPQPHAQQAPYGGEYGGGNGNGNGGPGQGAYAPPPPVGGVPPNGDGMGPPGNGMPNPMAPPNPNMAPPNPNMGPPNPNMAPPNPNGQRGPPPPPQQYYHPYAQPPPPPYLNYGYGQPQPQHEAHAWGTPPSGFGALAPPQWGEYPQHQQQGQGQGSPPPPPPQQQQMVVGSNAPPVNAQQQNGNPNGNGQGQAQAVGAVRSPGARIELAPLRGREEHHSLGV